MISASRVMDITNWYMVAMGCSVHRYSTIFGTFRLSFWGIASLMLINSLYLAALWTHYAHQEQMQIVRMLSGLLHDSVYVHLFIGVINCAVVLLEYRSLLAFASQVAERAAVVRTATSRETTAPSLVEWFVYYRMWMNTSVLLCLAVYNLCRIDLHSLTVRKVMLIVGLAYPHLLIADILRYVTIQTLLINTMWIESNRKLEQMEKRLNRGDANENMIFKNQTYNWLRWICFVGRKQHAAKNISNSGKDHSITMDTSKTSNDVSEFESLPQILSTYESYQLMYGQLQRIVRHQVCLLIAQHFVVIFIAVHMYVKVRLLWHVLLTAVDLHLLRINFVTFVLMIVNDYACLLLTSLVCQKQIKHTKHILTSLLGAFEGLHNESQRIITHFLIRFGNYYFDGVRWFGLFQVTVPNFIVIIFVHFMVVALIGTYQFLDTKIDAIDG